jgi:hypothetical protein
MDYVFSYNVIFTYVSFFQINYKYHNLKKYYMVKVEDMRKKKIVGLVLVWLMLLIIIGTSPLVSAGKSIYWIVTDGVIDISSDYVAYSDFWTGVGFEEQYAYFEWYVDSGASRGGSLTQQKPVGGTKAILSMTGSGNDLQLKITIYKGGASNPSGGPEIYEWNIIDGKDSVYDCITVVFTNLITGKTTKPISLYENDVVSIGIPKVLNFDCIMELT